jgi:hypothetical protein
MTHPVFFRQGRSLFVHVAVALVVVAASLSGCRKSDPDMPPVATPNVTFSRDRVALGSPVRVTYRFQVAANAKFDGDYWVFVHVLNPQGEQLWNDDHLPPTPTSSWKPGQTIQYTRTVFVPNYPYIGPAVVRIGLYDPGSGRRLVLNADEASRREYVVSRFQVLPSSENIFLIYKDGWHPAEVDTKNPTTEWQWTKKSATLSFRNPRKDVTLYFQYDARTDLFNPPQQVTLKMNGHTIAQFAAEARTAALKTFPITAAQLGAAEMIDLIVDVDRTFSPGAGDPRELGIRVFHVYLEPK